MRIGPTKTFVPAAPREGRRLPEGLGAFHRRDEESAEGLLLLPFRIGLPLTPPTRFPRLGETCFGWALQAPARGNPAKAFERASTFFARWTRLGLTTQARRRGSVGVVVYEADCRVRTYAGRSA